MLWRNLLAIKTWLKIRKSMMLIMDLSSLTSAISVKSTVNCSISRLFKNSTCSRVKFSYLSTSSLTFTVRSKTDPKQSTSTAPKIRWPLNSAGKRVLPSLWFLSQESPAPVKVVLQTVSQNFWSHCSWRLAFSRCQQYSSLPNTWPLILSRLWKQNRLLSKESMFWSLPFRPTITWRRLFLSSENQKSSLRCSILNLSSQRLWQWTSGQTRIEICTTFWLKIVSKVSAMLLYLKPHKWLNWMILYCSKRFSGLPTLKRAYCKCTQDTVLILSCWVRSWWDRTKSLTCFTLSITMALRKRELPLLTVRVKPWLVTTSSTGTQYLNQHLSRPCCAQSTCPSKMLMFSYPRLSPRLMPRSKLHWI